MFDVDSPFYEMFRPLVAGWTQKIEQAFSARSKWKELADECMMFYSKSAAAMWDPMYSRKFWRNVKAPKFRITMNKAFELVAVFGPNLMWDVPHRTVTPKKAIRLPDGIEQLLPPEMLEAYGAGSQQENVRNRIVSELMQTWLNYTTREQPNGLEGESELAIIDALIKGRGCLFVRPYAFPGDSRILTGAFRESPDDVLLDPDFSSHRTAKWLALRHVDPTWEVERRFRLNPGSLKGRGTLESSWSYGERQGSLDATTHRVSGQTNDLIVWYEIWSKTGCGARMTGMHYAIKDHLEESIGDYAYLAIAPSVPYPLNCATDIVRSGATTAEVKEMFSWPVPLWRDDRWPVEFLDFYPDPEGAWPIPPLAPAMGELKLLNFLVPWLCQRIWTSSRDFWAVAGPHVEHYTKYLMEGADQTVLPTPAMVDDVSKAVKILTQPETRNDVWRIIELVTEQFEMRTGLTAFAYGKNEGGTQNRTAEETIAKSRAIGVRPEHMQKQVVKWQSRISAAEGYVAGLFVKGRDVEPLIGQVGAQLWDQFIAAMSPDDLLRQYTYDIAASSIRRPNRDRDVANYQQVMQYFLAVMQAYGQQTGNYQPVNALISKWAEYHDVDLDDALFPPPQEPDPEQAQMQRMAQELELQKLQAEVQDKQAGAAQKLAQATQTGEADAQKMGIEAEKARIDMILKGQQAEQDMEIQGQKHLLDMTQAAADFAMKTRLQRAEATQKMRQREAEGAQKVRMMQRTNGKPK